MELPDLSAFPGWVSNLAYGLFSIGVAIVGFVGWLGLRRGRTTGAEPADNAQLAMVTLDSTAVRELTQAALGIGAQLDRGNRIAERYLTTLEQRQEEADLREAEQRGYDRARSENTGRTRPTNNPKRPT